MEGLFNNFAMRWQGTQVKVDSELLRPEDYDFKCKSVPKLIKLNV